MSLTAFPMDSQVTGTGDDGLPIYDRAFDSADLREVYKTYFGNGYFADDGAAMSVSPGDGMSVTVGAGKVNIQGTLGFMTEDETLAIDKAETSESRVDTVVARLDLNVDRRVIELATKHGTAGSSTPPTLTRTESVYELGLADITIPAGATSLSAADITDTRLDAERCGVAEPFAKLDTATLFEQVTAIIAEARESAESQEAELQRATDAAVSAMNDALSSTVLGSVWRLQSSSDADYLAYGDDLNDIASVGSRFSESASVTGGIQNKPTAVTGPFALWTFATEHDATRLGQVLAEVTADGVSQWCRAGAGSAWGEWVSGAADIEALAARVTALETPETVTFDDEIVLTRLGHLRILSVQKTVTLNSSWASVTVATLDAGDIPTASVYVKAEVDNNATNTTAIRVLTDGLVQACNMGSSYPGADRTVRGQLVWAVS